MSDPNPYPKVDYGRNTNRADVLIIGAGLSGMATAIEMIRKGNRRNLIIVEKGNQVGGTWSDQRYPGCACDVWSHLYSLSYEPNPDWTRLYPGQEEILDYLIGVAHKYQLYRYIRFNTAVEEARWDEKTSTWKTKLTRLGSKDAEFGKEYTVTSDFLVSAVGQLNAPQWPSIKGLDSFKGKLMHSARWDWDYDIQDKKIGIIGNGASSVQIVPEIAAACKSLTVFQRTPNWIVPRQDMQIHSVIRAAFRYLPLVRKRIRAMMMDIRESIFHVVFDTHSPLHESVMSMAKEHLEKQLPGEEYAELREKLQPQYAIGCKRLLVTDDYYPAFKRANVTLETSSIHEINENGVTLEGGKDLDFDLLVTATGFKTTQFMYPIKIYGSNGKSIEDIWSSGASAYLGMTVPEIPNFSMLYGPNTNLGHNSIILMIEAQAMYINTLISKVRDAKNRGGKLSISPKASSTQQYNDEIQARLSGSAFADPNCNSWYKNEAGLITNNWADTVVTYQKKTNFIDWEDFELDGDGAALLRQQRRTNWKRVVEETQISNTVLLGGLVTAAAVTGGALWRARQKNSS